MFFDFIHKIGSSWDVIYVGASACVCGAIGLFIAKFIIMLKKKEDLNLIKWRALAMIICLVAISLVPRINIFGHIGGLISGTLIGLTILSWGDA